MKLCFIALFIVTLACPAQSFSSMNTDQQPPQKKPKVDESEATKDVATSGLDENSENLAPWADRVRLLFAKWTSSY